MKEPVEFFDKDFLDNKIELGDKVIFEAPKYRDFVVGTVITKAPKSCQIEYINNWNYPQGKREVVRQYYGQVIKYPIKEGKWECKKIGDGGTTRTCSNCNITQTVNVYNNKVMFKYCPYCGAKMSKD